VALTCAGQIKCPPNTRLKEQQQKKKTATTPVVIEMTDTLLLRITSDDIPRDPADRQKPRAGGLEGHDDRSRHICLHNLWPVPEARGAQGSKSHLLAAGLLACATGRTHYDHMNASGVR
jgi:hypothetical protein